MRKESIWKTKDGQEIPISKMTDSHLVNTINYLRRNVAKNWRAIRIRDFDLAATAFCCFDPEGVASSYAELYMDEAAEDLCVPIYVEEHLEDNIPQYKTLLHHAKRRGLLGQLREYEAT